MFLRQSHSVAQAVPHHYNLPGGLGLQMGQMFIFYTNISSLESDPKIPAITASNDSERS